MDNLPVPIPLNSFEITNEDGRILEEMEEKDCSITTAKDLDFYSHADIFNESYYITLRVQSDLIRDLALSKEKAELPISKLKDPNLPSS